MEQQGTGGFILHRATPERQHDLLLVGQLPDRLPLMFAKTCFAELAKDLRYSAFAGGFDDIVQVNEPPAHIPGQNRSDGGLAGAHKASQDQPGKPPLCPGWLNIHLRIIERGRDCGARQQLPSGKSDRHSPG